jgi:hypothetical protein
MYFVTFWCGKCQTGSVVTVQSQFECGTIKNKSLFSSPTVLKTIWYHYCDNFSHKQCTELWIVNKFVVMRMTKYVFFLSKYSDSKCYWKIYSDFGGGKQNLFYQMVFPKLLPDYLFCNEYKSFSVMEFKFNIGLRGTIYVVSIKQSI